MFLLSYPFGEQGQGQKNILFGTALSFGINDEWNILYKVRSVSIFDCDMPLSWILSKCSCKIVINDLYP